MAVDWHNPAFSVTGITVALNNEPYVPGQIGASGLFEEDSVSTTHITVEREFESLSLVEPTERGGPGETIGDEDRDLLTFQIPHYQRDDGMKADEVQNVRAFGSDHETETVIGRMNRKFARHGRSLDLSLEHQRIGALKGIVLTKKGRVLANLYTKFEIAVPAPFELDPDGLSGSQLGERIDQWGYTLEDGLGALGYDHFRVYTGRNFHTKFFNMPPVRETYLNTSSAANLRAGTPDIYSFGPFIFERYKTGAAAASDLGSHYIHPDTARIVPVGVPDLFITRFGPADYEETVNTDGVPKYGKQWKMENGKGRRMEIQSNPVSICTRPQVLREITLI